MRALLRPPMCFAFTLYVKGVGCTRRLYVRRGYSVEQFGTNYVNKGLDEKQTEPAEVKAAVIAYFKAGAPGMVLSRKYAEMKLTILPDAGEAARTRTGLTASVFAAPTEAAVRDSAVPTRRELISKASRVAPMKSG